MESSLEIAMIREYAEKGAELRSRFFAECAEELNKAALCMSRCISSGGKILVCGNGGSAADAQHMTGELLGRFLMERSSLPAIALTVDSSTITAIGNDYGYQDIFARQVQGLGKPGDVLVAISTSGNSGNVIKAIEAAHSRSMTVVCLVGKGGGSMAGMSDYVLNVPDNATPLIQEMHESCIHLICHLIDHYLFEQSQAMNTDKKGV
jgi:D-sedoheptulose 7-phosphate isomerase